MFRRYAEPFGTNQLMTRKIYHIDRYDAQAYNLLLRRFEHHVDLVHDLTYELTRAANLVCDRVRECLDRAFRIQQGVLLVRRAAGMDMMERTYRLEYRGEERTLRPYPGLELFVNIRRRATYVRAPEPIQPKKTMKQSNRARIPQAGFKANPQ